MATGPRLDPQAAQIALSDRPALTDQAQPDQATVDELRRWGREQLRTCGHLIEPREAGLLIGHALGLSEAQIFAHGDRPCDAEQTGRIRALILRRANGVPFAYLASHREFYGRVFTVDHRVLIPRPETEHLIDVVKALKPPPRRILDLGTGSGCIATTLALEHPQSTIVAADISIAALAVAQVNTLAHGLRAPRVQLVAADLYQGLNVADFDTVVSNPPYISTDDDLPATVADFEPHQALFAGGDGLAFYRRLLGPETPFLRDQRVILELGANQRAAVEDIAQERFTTDTVTSDLAGWDRVISVKRTLKT